MLVSDFRIRVAHFVCGAGMPYKEFDVSGIGKVKVYKRRGNRSLRLSVTGTGDIRVSIPTWTPYQAGLAFTMSRRSWILSQSRPLSDLLLPNMPVGKTRHLRFLPEANIDNVRTNVRSAEVIVTYNTRLTVADATVQQAAQSACWRALKSEATKLLTPRLNELAQRYGYTYRSLSIKRMKSRWGSCDQHQNIVFNLFLVQLPWECIDYVILHELAHTRVLSHGTDFWNELESTLPGARSLRRTMRTYRPRLLVAEPPVSMP